MSDPETCTAPCWTSMRCLCAGHASGLPDDKQCDTSENRARFRTAYRETLAAAINNNPDEYAYGLDKVNGVVEKMLPALASGSANFEGAAKAAARRLGVKPTMRALREFLNS